LLGIFRIQFAAVHHRSTPEGKRKIHLITG
jgi:hypothetical protein